MRKNFGVKQYLYPMPVFIIGSYDENGNPNLMNAAWGGITDTDKISIAMSHHKTTENILKTKAFTVAIGTKEYMAACDYVGIVSGLKDKDKFKKSGFHQIKSEFVNAPIIEELPITLECELYSYQNEVLVGKIINVSSDEKFLGPDGLPDLDKFTPITYDPIHHDYLELGEALGRAFCIGKEKM